MNTSTIKALLALLILNCFSSELLSQVKARFGPVQQFEVNGQVFEGAEVLAPACIYYASDEPSHLDISPNFLTVNGLPVRELLNSIAPTSTFVIHYDDGFTQEAQDAFQFAVDIWSRIVVSNQDIVVKAEFSALGGNVLGSAGSNFVFRNFQGAPESDTFYSSALANALSNSDQNPEDETTQEIDGHDILARFSSDNQDWYFGTDGPTPDGKYDFVSVVLHELGHGLGFSGTGTSDGTNGSYGIDDGEPVDDDQPMIYDRLVKNTDDIRITSFSPVPSTELHDYLTTNNLVIDGTNVVSVKGGNAEIYAPSMFNSGSSFSHWDESTFNGSSNALMTPQIGTAERIHDVGDLTKALFEDMGWEINTLVTPSTSASSIVITNPSTSSLDISWTNGNGTGRLVIAREGQAPDGDPQDGTEYTANSDFTGNGADLGSGKVVYNSTGSSFTLSGLTTATEYFLSIFEYNSTESDVLYKTTDPATASESTLDDQALSAPTNQSSQITFDNAALSSMTVSWTPGNGNGRIVITREAQAPDGGDIPVDGTDYSADANFSGSGQALGTSKVVYDGNGSSFSLTGLNAGTTYFVSIFEYNNLTSEFLYNSSNPPVASQATTTVDAPTNLVSTAQTESSISLSWTDNSDVETGHSIERSLTMSSGFSEVGTASADATTFTDTEVDAGTAYFYRVAATNGQITSDFSNTLSISTSEFQAPSSLISTSQTETTITLSWDDNSEIESGFSIERSATIGGQYAEIETTSSDITTFTDTQLTVNTAYFYRVAATNGQNTSSFTQILSTATSVIQPPTEATVAAASTSAISLSWEDNSEVETAYIVERSLMSATGFEQITELNANTEAYSNTALDDGVEYFYRIAAKMGQSQSAYSQVVSATTLVSGTPDTLIATAISSNSIRLDWADVSTTETGFRVERSNSESGGFFEVGETVANDTSFLDTGLPRPNTVYFYRVRTYTDVEGGSTIFSDYTNIAKDTTLAPDPPSDVTLVSVAARTVTISWTDNTSSESEFVIERSLSDPIAFSQVGVVDEDVVEFESTSLEPNTTYLFRVAATVFNESTEYSDTLSVTTTSPQVPTTPPNSLSAEVLSTSEILIRWNRVVTTETSYTIERSDFIDGAFKEIGSVDASLAQFSSTGLQPNGTYYFRVLATNDEGSSDPSESVVATTKPAAPLAATNLQAVVVLPNEIGVAWVDNSFVETSYEMFLETAGNGFNKIAELETDSESFTFSSLVEATEYGIFVFAVNESGSTSSDTLRITTPKTAPGSPSNLSFEVDEANSSIILTWTDNASNEEGFAILRSSNSDGPFTELATVDANVTTYTDVVDLTTNNFYRVRAFNSGGNSENSNSVGITVTGIDSKAFVKLLKLYPNPTSDMFSLEFDQTITDQLQVSVLDYTGRIVELRDFEGTTDKSILQFDFTDKPRGLYLIQLKSSEFEITRRLLLR
ncbi:MAG: T9SS type A sorting domain-containing protein [Cyclobacteriaceae bacterium]